MPDTTSVFSEAALAYLQGERRLARIATVGRDGTPHVVPVGMWSYNPDHDTIDGRRATSPKHRIPVHSLSRSSAHGGTSCRHRTSGRSAQASRTAASRKSPSPGGSLRPWKRFQDSTKVELHRSVVPEGRHEIGDVDVDPDRARLAGDAYESRGRHVIEERVGDASANQDRRAFGHSVETLRVDDASEFALTPEDPIAGEIRDLVHFACRSEHERERLGKPADRLVWTAKPDHATPRVDTRDERHRDDGIPPPERSTDAHDEIDGRVAFGPDESIDASEEAVFGQDRVALPDRADGGPTPGERVVERAGSCRAHRSLLCADAVRHAPACASET
jgi:hypothetical protein